MSRSALISSFKQPFETTKHRHIRTKHHAWGFRIWSLPLLLRYALRNLIPMASLPHCYITRNCHLCTLLVEHTRLKISRCQDFRWVGKTLIAPLLTINGVLWACDPSSQSMTMITLHLFEWQRAAPPISFFFGWIASNKLTVTCRTKLLLPCSRGGELPVMASRRGKLRFSAPTAPQRPTAKGTIPFHWSLVHLCIHFGWDLSHQVPGTTGSRNIVFKMILHCWGENGPMFQGRERTHGSTFPVTMGGTMQSKTF